VEGSSQKFFCARLLGPQKGIGYTDQGHMTMSAQPISSFKVVKTKLIFESLVIELDSPPGVSDFGYPLSQKKDYPRNSTTLLLSFTAFKTTDSHIKDQPGL
jgi:hypothetical protein